jgi:hypothetical protein
MWNILKHLKKILHFTSQKTNPFQKDLIKKFNKFYKIM